MRLYYIDCDLLAGRGMLARNGNSNEGLAPSQEAEVFRDGLRRIEDAASNIGGVEVINVCLRKQDVKAYEQVSLDRLLNRINASVKAAGRHAFLIFDEGKERMITRAYRRLRIFNPVPSRYERWEEGERTRNIPVENVIGGPAFRSSDSDQLLQIADLISHALLKQEEEPSPRVETFGLGKAFSPRPAHSQGQPNVSAPTSSSCTSGGCSSVRWLPAYTPLSHRR